MGQNRRAEQTAGARQRIWMADELLDWGSVKRRALPKTILVVEDNEAIAHMLVEIVSLETPYKACLALTPSEALRLVAQQRPDLLLLDYYLPHMTGLQLYDRLRDLEGLQSVPAILLSANLPFHELKQRKIVALGKPFDLDKLLGAVEKQLGN